MTLTYFQGLRLPITFQLVSCLYDKWFTSNKFLRQNHQVSRAITRLGFIEHATRKGSILSP